MSSVVGRLPNPFWVSGNVAPDEDGEYLVRLSRNCLAWSVLGMVTMAQFKHGRWSAGELDYTVQITHWMDLPPISLTVPSALQLENPSVREAYDRAQNAVQALNIVLILTNDESGKV